MKKASLIILCLVLVLGSLYFFSPTKKVEQISYEKKQVVLGNTEYKLDIADTISLRERGLSYRKNLALNTGMLFVFDTPGVLKFWMKDMNFPIDIIWFDKDKKVVHIEHSLSPETYPNVYGPTIPTQYVIEIPVGDVEKIGLKVGDIISL
ncbi:MAG: DUF192 domain-containing protein [Minisyncoccota bacterium]